MSASRDGSRQVTRRDFLSITGTAGLAFSVLDSALVRTLGAQPAPATSNALDLAHGVLFPNAVRAPVSPLLYSGLRWRNLGPFRGGRVAAVSGVPGRPNEFYFGSVNGGVWKSTA